ncbi:ABC-3 protein [Sulfuricurvum kujiense DSM 16994]|uniref:ABC-3 protein n=1 Tax=Sulfuricurvum kujiense (strain ATCC BAA-921 / DSM 16994 / JCM 11577 / YK-1) TaxID=709032 RepID=E4U1R3_SULKY|nr:metal ABC transporter permease [Sulfuricurvum kujiense]ADR34536.1 ABC-3 protein [Sulfuricurvum kujiense DSM 16994]
MIDLFWIPITLIIALVAIHAWFGKGILERGIIFTDLSIAQMAALGSAVSLGYAHGEYQTLLTLSFALGTGLLIAWATTRRLQLEAFIGLIYVLGASGILMVLSHSAEGMEHFKSLLANDILFTTETQLYQSLLLYGAIALVIRFLYPYTDGFAREVLFFTFLALTVTSSVQLAGVLVVFVLLIAPVLAASIQQRFDSYPFALFFGWSFSIFSLFLAFYTDLPTGYTIVFTGALATLVAIITLSPKKDLNLL